MENIKERRKGFDQLGMIYPKEASVKIEQAYISEVNCYWFTPENVQPKRIIIYLHGGVFAVGSINSHGSMVSHFSNRLQSKILFVDYSLAPEKPYPAANNDVLNIYKELVNDYPDHQIDFIGDSAGGGLIIAAVGDIFQQDLPLPHAAVLISPWISLACDNPSQEENRPKDPILTREYLKNAASDYMGDTPLSIVSPENVKLDQFPPVLIIVGTNEVLLDDSKNFYNQIKNIQDNATLTIYENQNHVWPLANIHSEASQQALTEIEGFLMNAHSMINQ